MTEDRAPSSPWTLATTAAALLAVDPTGLAGIRVRAHAGPVRDRWLAQLQALLQPGTIVRLALPGPPPVIT